MITAQEANYIAKLSNSVAQSQRLYYIENQIKNACTSGKYAVEITLGIDITTGIAPNYETDGTLRFDDIKLLEKVGYKIENSGVNRVLIKWDSY